jgi:hypothetical protein
MVHIDAEEARERGQCWMVTFASVGTFMMLVMSKKSVHLLHVVLTGNTSKRNPKHKRCATNSSESETKKEPIWRVARITAPCSEV